MSNNYYFSGCYNDLIDALCKEIDGTQINDYSIAKAKEELKKYISINEKLVVEKRFSETLEDCLEDGSYGNLSTIFIGVYGGIMSFLGSVLTELQEENVSTGKVWVLFCLIVVFCIVLIVILFRGTRKHKKLKVIYLAFDEINKEIETFIKKNSEGIKKDYKKVRNIKDIANKYNCPDWLIRKIIWQ